MDLFNELQVGVVYLKLALQCKIYVLPAFIYVYWEFNLIIMYSFCTKESRKQGKNHRKVQV